MSGIFCGDICDCSTLMLFGEYSGMILRQHFIEFAIPAVPASKDHTSQQIPVNFLLQTVLSFQVIEYIS